MIKITILTLIPLFCFCNFTALSDEKDSGPNCNNPLVDFKNVFPLADVFDFKGEVKIVRVYQINYSKDENDFHDTQYVYQCQFTKCELPEVEITFKKNLDTVQIRHYSYDKESNLDEIVVRNPSSGNSATIEVIYLNTVAWISGTTYYHGTDNLIDSIIISASGQKQVQYFEYDNNGNITKDIFMLDTTIRSGYHYEYGSTGVIDVVTFVGEYGTIRAIWNITYDFNGFVSGFNANNTESVGTHQWGPYMDYETDNNGNWISRIKTSKATEEKVYKQTRTVEYF